MHFLNSNWLWCLWIPVAIGIYTIVRGGGWNEFLDNDMNFYSWYAGKMLYFFAAILLIAFVVFGWLIFAKK